MRSDQPTVLDLFCCQGAASKGYEDAGFLVVAGVDKDPQPRYPYKLVVGDAVQYLYDNAEWLRWAVDMIHASPPCQFDSDCQRIMKNTHPDLIEPTREALRYVGVPYVIENVRGAGGKLINPVMLCGTMFGIETYRHRYLETGGFELVQPEHPEHVARQTKLGRAIPPGEYGQFIGNFSGVQLARDVMGIPWMSRDGLRECIPPVYARWVGEQFLARSA